MNIGTAGSYDLSAYPIGKIVITKTQQSGDLGFMTKNGFKSLFDAKILNADLFPYKQGQLVASELSPFFSEIFADIERVNGNTVQTITNDPKLIEQYKKLYDIESMEGSGVFYVCLSEHINFVELRAISNSVGEEDRDKWQNNIALDALYNSCKNFFKKLSGER